MNKENSISRRDFLKFSAAAIASPIIFRSEVLTGLNDFHLGPLNLHQKLRFTLGKNLAQKTNQSLPFFNLTPAPVTTDTLDLDTENKFRDFNHFPSLALIYQSMEESSHFLFNGHSFQDTKDIPLPFDWIRTVFDREGTEGLEGNKFFLTQSNNYYLCHVSFVITDARKIPVSQFNKSFYSFDWDNRGNLVSLGQDGLDLPQEAKLPQQITLAVCSGKRVKNKQNKYSHRTLVTANMESVKYRELPFAASKYKSR